MSQSTLLTVLGQDVPCGFYVLRIQVKGNLEIPIGRFQGGKKIQVPAGEYIYLGSAMGIKGSATLARRLLRHATRGGSRSPHRIRGAMLSKFKSIGLGGENLAPPPGKRLFWNVDFLLEQEVTELRQVILVRTGAHLEKTTGRLLESDPCTRILVHGLGAGDAPGNTHLLRLECPYLDTWWRALPTRLAAILD